MNHRPHAARIAGLALAAALMLVASCTKRSDTGAPVDIKGTDPATGAPRATAGVTRTAPVVTSGEIVDHGDYKTVTAKNGDTVETLAARSGLSASALGAYNGLKPTDGLREGDELVLPPAPAGTGLATADPAGAPLTTGPIEATPLDGGTAVPADPAAAGASADGTVSPSTATAPIGPPTGWSPDIAAAAIDRSVGLKDDGTLGAPPSSTDPVPPEPAAKRELQSPQLSQYQTGASAPGAAPPPPPADAGTEITTAPATSGAATPSIRLLRPVAGPVAVGFNQGTGTVRNDGIDFAAPAGTKVVAAADGEVALVSESLGGLGTIVLVRHPNELLTVYGRLDKVSVTKGTIVRRGQQIGVVSNAPAPGQTLMHFEVRRGATVLDPTPFL